ncbi:TIGR02678 family protein [Streptomyces longwoodensis]|uniref:TIGR02678 family protein n=1 Tax=Streptomyces longwoodensis TaxID=68231 RepID=UPI0033DEFD96
MSQRDPNTAHERSTVIRALLMRPLLHRRGRHIRTLDLARRHQAELRAWFDYHLGWRLHVERDRLRLFKVPASTAPHGHPAPTARQCALYCLILAVLGECGKQTVLSELATKITALTSAHSRLRHFDATHHRERVDLVAMVRLLTEQGVLAAVGGESTTSRSNEKEYIAGTGDALYDVDHRTAALMLASPVPPSQADGPQALLDVGPTHAGTPEEGLRHTLMRRLVDEPVVHWDDLPSAQRDVVRDHGDDLFTAVRLGLDTRMEVRAEGAAVIDEELSDIEFPKSSAASFAALAMADQLCTHIASSQPRRTFVSHTQLDDLAAQLTEQLSKLVANINGQPIDTPRVLDASLHLLSQLGLITPVQGGIQCQPALARFRAPAGQGLRPLGDDLMLFGTHDLQQPTTSEEQ